MTKTKWHTRAIYILIALALAIGLTGIAAAPEVRADPGLTEWDKVTTPSEDDWVIAPESNVLLFTVGMSDGLESLPETIYAMGSSPDADSDTGTALWKSTDSGATWSDKTQKIIDCIEDEDLGDLVEINFIAAALDDADFLAVAAYVEDWTSPSGYAQQVFISDDGATEFAWPGDLMDGAAELTDIFCLAVSNEVDGKRNIAAAGTMDPDGSMPMEYICRDGDEVGKIFRLETGGLFGSWKDATAYEGWDEWTSDTTTAVTRVGFAPSWEADRTVLAITHTNEAYYCDVDPGDTYLQSGTWGTTKAWNEEADFADAVLIVDDVEVNWPFGRAFISGFATPFDYEGRHSGDRYAWVYVDYTTPWYDVDPGAVRGEIFQVINASVKPIEQQIAGMPWLANLSYWGTIDSGKAIAGLIGDGFGWFTDCCEGVQVYRNDSIEDMDICCKAWKEACKPPTGRFAVVAAFVAENKAYCVVGVHPYLQVVYEGAYDLYDESAFSFSLDDGENWNQIGLIDTYIDYLSDVAVNPACNAIWLASVNEPEWWKACDCDSVWYKADDLEEAEEYSGVWIREWCGELEGWWEDCINYDRQAGLLRLAPEETDESLTVYLVDRGTETVYYNGSKGLTCWESGHSVIDAIGDLAVKDEATIYALSMENGDVAFSDDHGAAATWEEAVDSEVDYGHTIAVHGDYVLVGGGYDEYCDGGGDASYSDDGGETFTALDDVGDDGDVHVAFDSYFDDNGTVYAALGYSDSDDGIYRCPDLEAGEWDDINALPYDYTGIVLDNADGNPMTDADTGGVLYASAWDITWDGDEFVDPDDPGSWYSGVARCLTPAEDVCCGEESWDYLIQGLGAGPDEYFGLQPSALKICGCLTEETNSKLWAIDDDWYDMSDGSDGTLWVYEDCFAKAAPALVTPADDVTIPADPCYCWNDEFVLKWDRQCNACSYDIQIAYDEEFDEIVPGWDVEEYEPPSGAKPSMVVPNLGLGTGSCATTFYWRVRSADAETDELIHSPWSEIRTFTVAQGPGAAIETSAPASGATNVPTTNVPFTWSSVEGATSYDFVLSANPDLSSPIVTETGLTTTAYTYTGTLSNDTSYYWQVSAVKDGRVISSSPVTSFTTKPAAPPPAPEPATPIWVWVVIGIGAVLVIVVIVLIFRTRRV